MKMAYATQITIGTGRKVSVNYQSREVQVGVTYQLEREDQNLLQLVETKAAEIETVHRRLWKKLKAERTQQEASSESNDNRALPPQRQEYDEYQSGAQSNGHTSNGQSSNGYSSGENSSNGYHEPNGSPSNGATITEPQERAVYALTRKIQMDPEEVERTLRVRFEKTHIQQLTKREASQFIDELQRKQRMKAGRR
jgi:hypothetical protein